MKRRYGLVLLLTLLPLAGAQESADTPVVVELEAFVIREVTGGDGAVAEERERAQTSADGQILVPPGQTVEYVLTLRNRGEATLPPGTVILRGPVPPATRYLGGSATPTSDEVRAEFSADGGQTFSEPPVVGADGDEVEAEAYNVVRWTLLLPLGPGQTMTFVYRVVVAET
ncbi:hypothetical protein BH24DEI1_BH24DEI1_07530 [soil metagenome]|jgi:uncharacterized repeat protein (TIGR01451 family)|nr:hypothetical protein [Deinococcota bacterium]